MANKQLAKISGQKVISTNHLKKFMQQWSRSNKSNDALHELNKMAKTALDKIRTISRASSKKLKLKSFIRTYAGTNQIVEAKKLLDQI